MLCCAALCCAVPPRVGGWVGVWGKCLRNLCMCMCGPPLRGEGGLPNQVSVYKTNACATYY
jgi:hypothetical protein